MSPKNFDVIIIGGGIVGLTIAYLISEKNKLPKKEIYNLCLQIKK